MGRNSILSVVRLAAFAASGLLAFSQEAIGPYAELERTIELLRPMVQKGEIPASRLAEFEDSLADRKDEAELDRLYPIIEAAPFLAEKEATAVLNVNQRIAVRQKARIERQREMHRQGLVDADSVVQLERVLASLEKSVEAAQASLTSIQTHKDFLVALEKQEINFPKWQIRPLVERFVGSNRWTINDFGWINASFTKQFGHGLPVSAFGQTPTHDALGFNHSGRVDVGILPDSREGQWLLALLRGAGIPFYAIRSALPGVSTAPHIHIGPPSTALLRGN